MHCNRSLTARQAQRSGSFIHGIVCIWLFVFQRWTCDFCKNPSEPLHLESNIFRSSFDVFSQNASIVLQVEADCYALRLQSGVLLTHYLHSATREPFSNTRPMQPRKWAANRSKCILRPAWLFEKSCFRTCHSEWLVFPLMDGNLALVSSMLTCCQTWW